MQGTEGQTKLTNPPTDQTKMTAATQEPTAFVKILRPVMVGGDVMYPKIAQPGEVVELPVSKAEELVGTKYRGTYAFSGERYLADGDVRRPDIRVAEYAEKPVAKNTRLTR